jgi:hypothetical protein
MDAAPSVPMSAVHSFVAGRGAIPIREVAAWIDRGHSYVYALVGRGQLRMFGPGKVTADSVIEFYRSIDSYRGGADEVARTSTPAVPVAADVTEGPHREDPSGQGGVTGAPTAARGRLS